MVYKISAERRWWVVASTAAMTCLVRVHPINSACLRASLLTAYWDRFSDVTVERTLLVSCAKRLFQCRRLDVRDNATFNSHSFMR